MRYDQISPVPPLTKVTKNVIILCVVVYFFDLITDSLGIRFGFYRLNEIFGLVPAFVLEKGWVWQFVTYIFMHGHMLHLLMNMLILWYFGAEIEMRLGELNFFKYFLLCGVGAGLFNFGVNLLVAKMTGTRVPSNPIVGASGAIFGILAAYGIFYGNRYFLVFFLFPMKAKYFVLLMAGIELVMGIEANPRDNVAHFAHIGGMAVGALYIYLKYVKGPLFGRGQSKKDAERDKLRRQFRLIVNQDDEENKQDGGGPSYWN